MLNVLEHEGNANQKNTEISLHSSQNCCNQEHKQHQMMPRMMRKRSPYTLSVRMQIRVTTVESSIEVLQKTKNRPTIQSSLYHSLAYIPEECKLGVNRVICTPIAALFNYS
jgi:hypothetical protein